VLSNDCLRVPCDIADVPLEPAFAANISSCTQARVVLKVVLNNVMACLVKSRPVKTADAAAPSGRLCKHSRSSVTIT
jgi:hypothetical protein